MDELRKIREKKKRWSARFLQDKKFSPAQTSWGMDLNTVYTMDDLSDVDYLKDIGFPGDFPFLRGVYPSMYRGRPWTMRQYAGYGTPEETNTLFKSLLNQGQMGLSVAFGLPTQIGFDSDNPLVEDEVGRVGVAVDTLKDMEIIFEGIPLDKITTSFTINPTASIILAMYIAVAEKQGVSPKQIGGTLQNDILKEYLARGTQIFPLRPSLRLIGDIIEYCKDNVPRMNTISICGYHMREAGCNLIQEIAYGLSDAIVYVEEALKRGINVDEFAPRLSFLFGCGVNLFEEVAKLRAARRLWAKIMKERFGANNQESMKLRLFSGCLGSAFTSKEPLNNIVRGTIMALVAVLAGCQAIHVTSYDEAYTIPSEEAQRTALRTQQIIFYETDVAAVADPMGGSYFLEYLTNKIEEEVQGVMAQIEERGGILKGIEDGSIQREITRGAYESEKKIQNGEKVIVGVNKFVSEEKEYPIQIYPTDKSVWKKQISRLKEVKAKRNQRLVDLALGEIRRVAAGKSNLMVPIFSAVCEYATVGEICNALKEVFGEYKEIV
ncbi:MAG: methylmalonyl-CoA mutase [Deltaproteobacteria bacterium CG_4_8_14_3_um_filter_45_9]|nr:MAG: methylmalonyl-CoA mutase [Deltaproteobacteria bacterium CG03_land_8_20_14_0_80_45_14]PIX23207.1 MAG: methylmalonyl-CoA mutase [Deltaproteobacteria bacterium CG_4_8_14_3_um_filter_45_9]